MFKRNRDKAADQAATALSSSSEKDSSDARRKGAKDRAVTRSRMPLEPRRSSALPASPTGSSNPSTKTTHTSKTRGVSNIKAARKSRLKKSLSDPSLSEFSVSQCETPQRQELTGPSSVQRVKKMANQKSRKQRFWPFRRIRNKLFKKSVKQRSMSVNLDEHNGDDYEEDEENEDRNLKKISQHDSTSHIASTKSETTAAAETARAALEAQKIQLEIRKLELELKLKTLDNAEQQENKLRKPVSTKPANVVPDDAVSDMTDPSQDSMLIIKQQQAQIESLQRQLRLRAETNATAPIGALANTAGMIATAPQKEDPLSSLTNPNNENFVTEMQWTLDPPHQMTGWYTGPIHPRTKKPQGPEGYIRFSNGDTYEGPFSNGQMFGRGGVYRWNFGDVYRGSFWNNLRHGHGETTMMQGRQLYKGSYEYGKQHGYGELYSLDKTEECFYRGQWDHGEPAHKFLDYIGGSKRTQRSGLLTMESGDSTFFPIATDLSLDPREEAQVSRYDMNSTYQPAKASNSTSYRSMLATKPIQEAEGADDDDDESFDSSEEGFGLSLYATNEVEAQTKREKKATEASKGKSKSQATQKDPKKATSKAVLEDAISLRTNNPVYTPQESVLDPGVVYRSSGMIRMSNQTVQKSPTKDKAKEKGTMKDDTPSKATPEKTEEKAKKSKDSRKAETTPNAETTKKDETLVEKEQAAAEPSKEPQKKETAAVAAPVVLPNEPLSEDAALQMTIMKLKEKVMKLQKEKTEYHEQVDNLKQNVTELEHEKKAKAAKLSTLEESFQNINTDNSNQEKDPFIWKSAMGAHKK